MGVCERKRKKKGNYSDEVDSNSVEKVVAMWERRLSLKLLLAALNGKDSAVAMCRFYRLMGTTTAELLLNRFLMLFYVNMKNPLKLQRSGKKLLSSYSKDKIALLNKRLQTSESEKSEYIKCYEDAMNDKKQLTHEYMNRITELRVPTAREQCQFAREEAEEWKRKYDIVVREAKAALEKAAIV
ncbi:hypothetical protein JHK82_050998 [Glycine max]|nr:hypothetical protein JHK85_051699 [Glycine max]KAG5092220.1 hypothetical protein JHK82_050998 [Glycine max]